MNANRHPNHNVEALLLLAIALSSKRRPAELQEIIAAADLIEGLIPGQIRLRDAFSRLATRGLIVETEDNGFALTENALPLVADASKKDDLEQRLNRVKTNLAAYEHAGELPGLLVTPERFDLAILSHRAAAASKVKNLLIPKPKPDGQKSRPGQRQRKPMPAKKTRQRKV
jgi:hypothetical protein